MTCNEARDALLVADPTELADRDGTPLGNHLRECTYCREVACAIGADISGLGMAVRRRSRQRALALAAAVALPIAAAIVVRVSARPTNPPVVDLPRPATASISVDVQPGQRATVLKTKDPNVTIVWVTPAEGL